MRIRHLLLTNAEYYNTGEESPVKSGPKVHRESFTDQLSSAAKP